MSDANAQPEPSIEEILATISRIIAEDKPAGATPPGAGEDVLELTEAVGEDGTVRHLSPLQAAGEAPPGAPPATDRILSPASSGAAAAAFAQLGSAARERRREGEVLIGGGDRTLEDIVRDMLRPLLQSWLDQHLSGLVERLVREEIARVVGEAGLR